MKVFFYEVFDEELKYLKLYSGNPKSFGYTKKTIQESNHEDPPAKIISIRTQSRMPLEWSKKIQGVQTRSTGYDHLNEYISQIEENIPCGYLKEYATRAVAEHAVLLLISLVKKIKIQLSKIRRFDRDCLTGEELLGKKLLIVGVGRIGSEIALLAKGLGMSIRGVDIVEKHKNIIEYIPLKKGLKWADIIICSMNLTKLNYNYFNYNTLIMARKGAIFINIARGELSPLRDLKKLVDEKWLSGLGLDVYEHEPILSNHLRGDIKSNLPIVKTFNNLIIKENVIFTPHNAFNTIESVRRKALYSIEEIKHFMKNGKFNTAL